MTVSTIDNCREAPEPLICLITELTAGLLLLLPGSIGRERGREKSVPSSDVAYSIEFMYILYSM